MCPRFTCSIRDQRLQTVVLGIGACGLRVMKHLQDAMMQATALRKTRDTQADLGRGWEGYILRYNAILYLPAIPLSGTFDPCYPLRKW